ncbi:hypothetical protein BZA70DRAFT_273969 [Myxozyma melibiosi]|uniref:Ty3 transposon capsid-like protein domain-containing protein n=1 Tax=Myxozyma melibiosi TaxID=54550 RepID=A0ABR1FFJ6_9ASCO
MRRPKAPTAATGQTSTLPATPPTNAPVVQKYTAVDPAKVQAAYFRELALTEVDPPSMIPLDQVPRGIIRTLAGWSPLPDDTYIDSKVWDIKTLPRLDIPKHVRYSGDLSLVDGKLTTRVRLYTFYREFLNNVGDHFAHYKNSEIKNALNKCLYGPAQMKLGDYATWRKHPTTTLLDIYRFLALEFPEKQEYDPAALALNAFQSKGESPYAWVNRLENLADHAPKREGCDFDIVLNARSRCTSSALYKKLEDASRKPDVKALKRLCATLVEAKYMGTAFQFDFNTPINDPENAREYMIPNPDGHIRIGSTQEEKKESASLKRKAPEQSTSQETATQDYPPRARQRTISAGGSRGKPAPRTQEGCKFCLKHNFSSPASHTDENCFNKDHSKRPKKTEPAKKE